MARSRIALKKSRAGRAKAGDGSRTLAKTGTTDAAVTIRTAGTAHFVVPASKADELRNRGFSNDEIYSIVAPRRTLARRKEKGEDLTVSESDRVHRLERVSEMADRIFGSHEKAQRWLRSDIAALDGARPIDLLQSETGAHLVEQELIRIDFGVLA